METGFDEVRSMIGKGGRIAGGKTVLLAAIIAVACSAVHPAEPEQKPLPMNLYEWIAVAPELVVARVLSQDGRYVIAEVETTLRGTVEADSEILVDLREANRQRTSSQLPLRLLHGENYILLLETAGKRKPRARLSHQLSRGVDGAWLLPREGAPAVISAINTFLEIQELASYNRRWSRFEELLESSINPLVLESVLDMFLKFRRGGADLLPTVEPLLDHPRPAIRARAADLAWSILDRTGGEPPDSAQGLVPVLLARARRDPSVEVRVASTRAIGSLAGARIETVLQEIADKDEDQAVRYEAEKLLDQRSLDRESEDASPGDSAR